MSRKRYRVTFSHQFTHPCHDLIECLVCLTDDENDDTKHYTKYKVKFKNKSKL